MFAAGWGIREDPATGSAAAAFAGVHMRFAPLGDGEHTVVIDQGIEMGRPSRIALGLEVDGGALVAATIGGPVALIGEGALEL
jgi:trans-2,3-dihydro-3-hydroxyanthranilate isomerase